MIIDVFNFNPDDTNQSFRYSKVLSPADKPREVVHWSTSRMYDYLKSMQSKCHVCFSGSGKMTSFYMTKDSYLDLDYLREHNGFINNGYRCFEPDPNKRGMWIGTLVC